MATTLYEEIGGEEKIRRLVTSFYQHVLADPILQPFFDGVSIKKLENMQIAFFSAALGNAENTDDFDLYQAHAHLNLNIEHLTRFTNHLLSTLKEIGIEEERCNRIYERIATYSNDILGESSVDG